MSSGRKQNQFVQRVVQIRLFIILLLSYFFSINLVSGQKGGCIEIAPDSSFTVHSVRIMGRWVPKELRAKIDTTIGIGHPFNDSRVSLAQNFVSAELDASEQDMPPQIKGAVSVFLMTTDYCKISENDTSKQVQIVFRPFYIRVDILNIGNNILPIPRSTKPTFYSNVPAPILIAAPLLGFQNDRQYGSSVSFQTMTDLLNIPKVSKSDSGPGKMQLNVELDARKSLSDPFHTLGVGLDLIHPVYIGGSTGWNFGIQFSHDLQPLGKGTYKHDLAEIHGAILGGLKSRFFSKYIAGAGASFLQNRYTITSNTNFQNRENGYKFFLLTDGRLGRGFNRVGIWFNAGFPKGSNALKSYQSLAGRLGYATSFNSKRNTHNAFDLETTLGSGYTWGIPPSYNLFFAGNTAWNFLYEPFTSSRNRDIPKGPVIRSLGEREGGLSGVPGDIIGGTSFWHLNVSISIPIGKWSRPLIPDIEVEGNRLQTLVKKQAIRSSKLLISEYFQNIGLPESDETDMKADSIVEKDITPLIEFVTDRANLYSIKPLLLFDLGQVHEKSLGNKGWIGAGAGVQINLVIARLEFGYIQTLSPPSDSSKGNFVLRFTFQNFY